MSRSAAQDVELYVFQLCYVLLRVLCVSFTLVAAKEHFIMAESVRDRLKWKQGEEIIRWILRVEVYATSQE